MSAFDWSQGYDCAKREADAKLATLSEENRKLREMLDYIQWEGWVWVGNRPGPACPVCHSRSSVHTPECALAALLKEEKCTIRQGRCPDGWTVCGPECDKYPPREEK